MNRLSSNTEAVTDTLAGMIGAEHVRTAHGAITATPANTEEVAAILRWADANHCPVTPWGGGTKQAWGNKVAPVVVLETGRLNKVREHTWQDMTCTVEAGCTWPCLQEALAQHGQFVAVDPLWPEQATVGGVVATNDSGALRLRYGGLRDLVIGMTVVLADGTVAHTGGKVVKNVAGYDLHKLMIGAFGTLGVVSSVNFRLHSMAQCTRSFSISSATAEPLGKLMMKLLHGQLSLVAVQIRGMGEGFALDIQLASLADVLRTQAAALEGMAAAEGLVGQDAAEGVWNARQSIMVQDLVVKATMLPSDMVRFAEHVRSLSGISVTQATGIMMAGFPSSAAHALEGLRREYEGASGSLMVLQQTAESQLSCWGTAPDSLPLMREVKRRFDPGGVLNPGRYLGGI